MEKPKQEVQWFWLNNLKCHLLLELFNEQEILDYKEISYLLISCSNTLSYNKNLFQDLKASNIKQKELVFIKRVLLVVLAAKTSLFYEYYKSKGFKIEAALLTDIQNYIILIETHYKDQKNFFQQMLSAVSEFILTCLLDGEVDDSLGVFLDWARPKLDKNQCDSLRYRFKDLIVKKEVEKIDNLFLSTLKSLYMLSTELETPFLRQISNVITK